MKNKVLIIAIDTDWVGISRLPSGLTRAGFEVFALCPLKSYLAKTRYLKDSITYPTFTYSRSKIIYLWIIFAIIFFRPDIIVPGDEDAILALQKLRKILRDIPLLGKISTLIDMSFTAEKFDSLILCKSEFQQKCQQWGLRAPKNMVVENIEIAILESQSWGFPIVLKLDSGYGGSGVFICHNELDLRTHFLKLRSVSLFYKVKNWAKNIFFVSVLSTGSKVSIQEFIDGQVGQSPFCARKGKVFAINSMLKLETHPGKTGPSSVSGGYENQDIDFYVSKVAKNLNYSGFGSLEYIVQKDTGQIYIIEMNPRPTPTCHIGNSFVTNDLCDMLYRGLNSLPLETRKFRPFTLALYPNEKKRDPHSKYLATSFTYHDIPLDDPELIKALT